LGVDGGIYFVGEGRAPLELVIVQCKLQSLTPSDRPLELVIVQCKLQSLTPSDRPGSAPYGLVPKA
jgi:hypothetical protein